MGEFLLSTPVSSAETGQLGVRHLKRFWAQQLAQRAGQATEPAETDWRFDNILLNGLGLPLQETLRYLLQVTPSFEEFEQWILARNSGWLDPHQVERLNSLFTGQPYSPALREHLRILETSADVLSPDDLRFWAENGYVIVRGAVPREQAQATEQAVWNELGMDPHEPATWYEQPIGQGIMMNFYHHPTLRANRQAARIQKAFAQLWQTADLWTTTDRTSFNPPETRNLPFQGPHLHWDVSLEPPFHFGTQGLLYLCDTSAEQGAFCCVPGFHRELEGWLAALPAGTDPRRVNLDARAVPIAAQAGDFVIWHHLLPHGSSPNRGTYPRIVQYINMYPVDFKENKAWL
ncbi:Phytanoyl-CoA dioxygenase (PhyH) [Hymenobacter daecheongensis DSM 21074]|uniref:Phytanoyl-CoA dioxygenase (PhyH) n=1 Tax=Hymenobacter daecheongensis DSM 21074 TaxID=1121955 RepID=A0A1M6H4C6_9BACT|nr:phytanoyl-CoA dioxygenase family protein [Hymenobacter daecheongensis]SHJ17028.1 Phytanoyl-CoA dioxygenase (PhyH) [Hymenobacter daecheongensis DSM 21074]